MRRTEESALAFAGLASLAVWAALTFDIPQLLGGALFASLASIRAMPRD